MFCYSEASCEIRSLYKTTFFSFVEITIKCLTLLDAGLSAEEGLFLSPLSMWAASPCLLRIPVEKASDLYPSQPCINTFGVMMHVSKKHSIFGKAAKQCLSAYTLK